MAGRRDEAIHLRCGHAEPWIASLALAKTMMEHSDLRRHCEERSDEAIHTFFFARWMASLALATTAQITSPRPPLRCGRPGGGIRKIERVATMTLRLNRLAV